MTITQQVSAFAAKQAAQTIAYPDAHKDNATYIRYLTINRPGFRGGQLV